MCAVLAPGRNQISQVQNTKFCVVAERSESDCMKYVEKWKSHCNLSAQAGSIAPQRVSPFPFGCRPFCAPSPNGLPSELAPCPHPRVTVPKNAGNLAQNAIAGVCMHAREQNLTSSTVHTLSATANCGM